MATWLRWLLGASNTAKEDDQRNVIKMSLSTLEPKLTGPSSSVPAIQLADTGLSNNIFPRTRSIETLAHLIDEHAVIHVRGTPASGKSTMAKLLFRHYSRHDLTQQQPKIVFVADWKDWVENNMDTVGHKIQRAEFLNEANDDLIFILDEAHVTYSDSFFWYSVIKEHLAATKGPRFCLFTSYGSPSTGSPDYPKTTTPPILKREQRISLIAPHDHVGHDLCLFYKQEESKDAVKKWADTTDHTIGEDVASYIFEQTNGHPGVAGAMLRYVALFYRDHLKRYGVSHITYQHVGDALENNYELFKFLNYDVAEKSLPSKARLQGIDPLIVGVLLRILTHGSLEFIRNNDALEKCFRLGFIHVDEPEEGYMICVLPSFLHARFVEYTYGLSMMKPSRFSRTMLCMAERGQRYGPSGKPRPVEAAYQDELYRSFAEEVGPGVGIVSERSCVGQGRIDFHMITPGWGFELLRDSDWLLEHCKRFEPQGTYHQSIRQGLLTDWLILDCRHSIPRKLYSVPKLWRIIFSQDYSRARILNGDNEEIHPEFFLINH
ncbi:uncharacterized protein EURHEDRAFT_417763 [Aspergillus ruber CBS 135680]|uniref:Uncharacterized protein n=1 Tax=Aspergillus ruber (strain CBS 135680) TaxID=1388766 RepID=A0A017RZM9_ASPRC|nr:uncharacterized protein EURHEDRAFT_417763 [Aspergillus ruber CBS 135680]EYE90117.1 hypothetical protein EURHEDRAFT_417763 [Aspergillus ruber CBS 135680]